MTGCCAFGCSQSSGSGKKLFAVPLRKADLKRQKVWLHMIGRKNFVPTRSSKLCEDHFAPDQFEPRIWPSHGIKTLKPDAVPTKFSHRLPKPVRRPPQEREMGNIQAGEPMQEEDSIQTLPFLDSTAALTVYNFSTIALPTHTEAQSSKVQNCDQESVPQAGPPVG
ncbi:peroxynitrite isomerase THAP4-like [Ixodes scapularis]|uniref:peroxynitrite isomerase THAP4-like n=1 Tax=Ixodes scapularis TaxID=6945 RepID=UPI001A9F9B25|nr:peroxynitrite isomerase THAP4-like [Ixodes scapularis]